MIASEFINISRETISNDPNSRLSEITINSILDPNCIFDIHAHIFDKKCLSVAYILLRMVKSKVFESFGLESLKKDTIINKNEDEIYKEIESYNLDQNEWMQLEEEINELEELVDEVELFGFNLKDAFRVLKKDSMLEVLDYYTNQCSLKNLPEYNNVPLVTGVLLMDLETGWGINPQKKLYHQIDEIKEILKIRPIIPFFPIDPRRAFLENNSENLYDLFLRAFNNDNSTPFFGIKCYPSLGYLPTDDRLDPIFKICTEKKIPVITHCGGEVVSTYNKTLKVHTSNGIEEITIKGKNRKERARFLNDPLLWKPVLEKYNNLKLCFGHFGDAIDWEEHSNLNFVGRISNIIEMMNNNKWNVYADISFNIIKKNIFDTFLNELNNNPNLSAKTMFGTDYWVVLPSGDLLKMEEEFLNHIEPHRKSLLNSAPKDFLFST